MTKCAKCYYGAAGGNICCAGYQPETCTRFKPQYKCRGGFAYEHPVTKEECYECAKQCRGCDEMRVVFGFDKAAAT